MNLTPDEHVDAIKTLCEKLSADPMIKSAEINDWGRFSNFDVHIVPMEHNRHTTRKLKAAVKKALAGTGAHLRDVFPPTAEYRWCSVNRKNELIGYDRCFWAFDIDYFEYDPEINRFSVQSQ